MHSSKEGGQHSLPSPRSSTVTEHRHTHPLGKQEAAMLLPVCLEKERMFSFCEFPAKRGLRHRENKEFKGFTNPSLEFSYHFLDVWTVLWSRDCSLWGMNKLADVRCTGQVDNQWQVPQGAPSEESTPVTIHLPDLQVTLALGEASQARKIKFMQAVDFPLMQRSKRSDLVWGKYTQTLLWGRCTRNEGYFSYPGKIISSFLNQ